MLKCMLNEWNTESTWRRAEKQFYHVSLKKKKLKKIHYTAYSFRETLFCFDDHLLEQKQIKVFLQYYNNQVQQVLKIWITKIKKGLFRVRILKNYKATYHSTKALGYVTMYRNFHRTDHIPSCLTTRGNC